MRLLVNDVEQLDDVAVIFGVDLAGHRRSAVIALDHAPLIRAALAVSRLAAVDIDAAAVITEDPFV